MPKSKLMAWAKAMMLRGQYNWAARLFAARVAADERPVALCWNGLNSSRRVFMDAARDAGAQTLFFELAPLPGRITVDPMGVNFANALPRKAGPYLDWAARNPGQLGGWRQITTQIAQRQPLVATTVPKQNRPEGERFIFVPLQLEGDSQLSLFGGPCRSVAATVQLICQAAANLPAGWHIRLKEHPNALTSIAPVLAGFAAAPVYLDNETDTFSQVRAADLVLTVNSSVGLEAMLFERPVATIGQCFWSFAGVAHQAPTAEALAQLCAAPDQASFDPASRDAFLSFLTAQYYPTLTLRDDQTFEMTAAERAKITARLNGRLI
ncbi:MAG: capsular biosynthesis protein [Rhodobacteraceae bacterium]|nr:capsular biosynthesis protein [Paracoccaceae bacterium]